MCIRDSYSSQKPDIILHNANIITVNPLQPKAEAIAISEDKIIAIGNNDEILNLASSITKKIDIDNKTITPGFIDAHSHPAASGRSHLIKVDCDLRSIEEIKSQGLFNHKFINELINNHSYGKVDSSKSLWSIIAFQIWYKNYYE